MLDINDPAGVSAVYGQKTDLTPGGLTARPVAGVNAGYDQIVVAVSATGMFSCFSQNFDPHSAVTGSLVVCVGFSSLAWQGEAAKVEEGWIPVTDNTLRNCLLLVL